MDRARRATVRYYQVIDTLVVDFFGPNRPTYGRVMDNNITLRLDPETDAIVGVEIDHFFTEVVPKSKPKRRFLWF